MKHYHRFTDYSSAVHEKQKRKIDRSNMQLAILYWILCALIFCALGFFVWVLGEAIGKMK